MRRPTLGRVSDGWAASEKRTEEGWTGRPYAAAALANRAETNERAVTVIEISEIVDPLSPAFDHALDEGDGVAVARDLRPSVRYPTLELRVCDACPRVADAVALVALYVCLVREALEAHRAGAPEPAWMKAFIDRTASGA